VGRSADAGAAWTLRCAAFFAFAVCLCSRTLSPALLTSQEPAHLETQCDQKAALQRSPGQEAAAERHNHRVEVGVGARGGLVEGAASCRLRGAACAAILYAATASGAAAAAQVNVFLSANHPPTQPHPPTLRTQPHPTPPTDKWTAQGD